MPVNYIIEYEPIIQLAFFNTKIRPMLIYYVLGFVPSDDTEQ